MDWIYIWPRKKNGIHEYQWNLIVSDSLSVVIKIKTAKQPERTMTVDALMEWRSLFGNLLFCIDDDERVPQTV